MWLLIDDMRDLSCDAIARNSKSAMELLKCNCWECVCFDHDLGEDVSGYDVMKSMFNLKIYPKQIQIVTSNPVGRDNMMGLLNQESYHSKDNINWFRQ